MHMHKLLKKPTDTSVHYNPYHEYVTKQAMQKEMTIMRRLGSSNHGVENSHPLVRLLSTAMGYLVPNQSDSEAMEVLDFNSEDIGASIGVTSYADAGRSHIGSFYSGATELYLLDSTPYDPTNLSPVRVWKHSANDLNMDIPNGMAGGRVSKLAVITINIVQMVMMYRKYLAETEGEPVGMGVWVYTRVLVGMLPSHNRVCWWNLHIDMYRGYSMTQSKRGNSGVATIKIDEYAISSVEQWVRDMTRGFVRYPEVLDNLRGHSLDGWAQFELPESPDTMQNRWVLTLVTLPALSGLLDVVQGSGTPPDGVLYTSIRKSLKLLKQNIYVSRIGGSVVASIWKKEIANLKRKL